MSELLLANKSDLVAVADAIRTKAGGSGSMSFPNGFVDSVNNMENGGEDYLEKRLDGTLNEYSNSKIASVVPYAFYGCSNLTNVSFPKCTSIGTYAFYNCSKLTNVYSPSCKTIGNGAFYNCSSLSSINFPVVSSIGNYAFSSCYKLTTANFPIATSTGNYAFHTCSKLTTANFPSATSIGENAFIGCSSLISISFPMAKNIGSYAFKGCSKLTLADFPNVTRIESSAFDGCSSLTIANFPVCTSVGGYAFNVCYALSSISFPALQYVGSAFQFCSALYSVTLPAVISIASYALRGCTSLMTLILPSSYRASLLASNALFQTPMYTSSYTGAYGSIYVPASLVSNYQAASNWSYYSARFVALPEEEPEEPETGDNGDDLVGDGNGQWLPMAADGVSCMGEQVTIGGTNSAPYEIELLASDTNQYKITIDGNAYMGSVVIGENSRNFVIDGYAGTLRINWYGSGTGYIRNNATLSLTCALKLERWVTS